MGPLSGKLFRLFKVKEARDAKLRLPKRLYKITKVSRNHEWVGDEWPISCQMFDQYVDDDDISPPNTHVLTGKVWHDFPACTLSSVDTAATPNPVNVLRGAGIKECWKAGSLVLQFDLPSYHAAQVAEAASLLAAAAAGDEPPELEEDEDAEPPLKVFNPSSMEDVAMRMPDFTVKSMLEVLVLRGGHILELSPKFHAELAGQGVEYDFGRCKWWFRKYNSHSTAGLREKSLMSFGADVVTLAHTRKFARRARDYERAYRRGHKGLSVEDAVKQRKSHRSVFDSDRAFCAAVIVLVSVSAGCYMYMYCLVSYLTFIFHLSVFYRAFKVTKGASCSCRRARTEYDTTLDPINCSAQRSGCH